MQRVCGVVLALVAAVATAAPTLQVPKHDPVEAARGLIHRRLGPSYNDQVQLT
jgi:hypothetical protein